ncbi:carbohydrate ABC transporter permease [Diplocloster agilis]|uniref:carbohydrate ABC transporter permease n=1 Tax=Diplocloster agilis TaxID=2850323 RepID=UPI0008234C58|nr:sugar ABC transporter permease [Suonthocola fibrivorans]MCU6733591.1 sugar ABC transporter permease [Suonthocola fibrivorans]SCI99402.1 sn-glycerol-3-phosphate transport system permease protein ugpA [uncultured Clostridium sp.]
MRNKKNVTKPNRRGIRAGWLFLAPSLAGEIIFVLLPFLDVVKRSFTTAVTGQFSGFSNYKLVFQNEAFRLAAGNTLRFTAVCLPLLIIGSLLLAVMLSRQKYVRLLKSCFLFPMAVPAAAVALVWKMLFARAGLLSSALLSLGMQPVDWMNTGMAFWVLVVSYLWKNTGYTIILWLAGIMSIPDTLLEAARADGAGEWKCFTKIMLPNLKPMLYTITVLSFLNSFKVFREAYLVAGGYPDGSMYLLQHLFNNWFTNMEFDKMAAAAVVIAGILYLAVTLLQKLWEQEEAA